MKPGVRRRHAESIPLDAFERWDRLEFHQALARFNHDRFSATYPGASWREDIARETAFRLAEGAWVESERAVLAERLAEVPTEPNAFVAWFEALKDSGPGQGDPLFDFLATRADRDEMRWFVEQEMAGEAGFDDLVALTQVKMPIQAKLELARNYWDEMGRGNAAGMHGPMLERIGAALEARGCIDTTVWESLALANMMLALAGSRRYAYQSIGALGVIEMTAPGRVVRVDRGLARLGIASRARQYYKIHATLDRKHSASWNREVIASLVATDPANARAIAEGALLRLTCGARSYERYRKELRVADRTGRRRRPLAAAAAAASPA
ncbi:MAG: hypothetical protein JWL84_2170 [Rhodospirillales bacterium]|nr:hypothetical protein [Rhodospirillales bacterium]